MGRYLSSKVSTPRPGISYTKDIYGTGNYRLFFNSGTWEVPVGVSSVRVMLIGGGGGPGGTYISRANPACCFTCDSGCNVNYWRCINCCYELAHAYGGGGGGGGFTIGTTSVTPGCVCCVVIGAGGAGGTNTAGTCTAGGAGSAGGYTCAFGICATGGGGGIGAPCVCCGRDGSLAACWLLTTYPTSCAVGGSGNGNLIVVCGNPGSTPCGFSCNSTRFNSGFGVGYGGASGSPLGYDATTATACQWAIPDRMNGAAFDGRQVGWCDLQLDYGLDNPRYPGQIIYTQYCDTKTGCGIYHLPGVIDGWACGCLVSSCSALSCGGSATCCYINARKQLWQGSQMCDQCFYVTGSCGYCCYVGTWYCTTNSKCIYPGCGGGGIPSVWISACMGVIQPFTTVCQMNAKSGGAGMAVVEW